MICQELIKKPTLFNEIAYIASNYGFLSKSIEKLETRGLPLVESIETVATAKLKIDSVVGKAAQSIKRKIETVLSKNTGYNELSKISEILKGECQNITITDTSNIKYFKFAPVVSVETERSFSLYKNVLTENRTNFLFENLKRHIVVYCNETFNH